MLYQLSYFRIIRIREVVFSFAVAKVDIIFEPPKYFADFFEKPAKYCAFSLFKAYTEGVWYTIQHFTTASVLCSVLAVRGLYGCIAEYTNKPLSCLRTLQYEGFVASQ